MGWPVGDPPTPDDLRTASAWYRHRALLASSVQGRAEAQGLSDRLAALANALESGRAVIVTVPGPSAVYPADAAARLRAVRDATGCDLRTAKEAIEAAGWDTGAAVAAVRGASRG